MPTEEWQESFYHSLQFQVRQNALELEGKALLFADRSVLGAFSLSPSCSSLYRHLSGIFWLQPAFILIALIENTSLFQVQVRSDPPGPFAGSIERIPCSNCALSCSL